MNDDFLTAQVAPSATSGGSAASQAYREQLERDTAASAAAAESEAAAAAKRARTTPTDDVAKPAPFVLGSDARAAERKKVGGRARIAVSGATGSLGGKMIDISLTGACILLDNVFPTKKVCTLECDIFQNGKRHAFQVQAVSVYGVLASGHGFKVGFQFGPRSPAVQKTIAELLK